MCCGLSTLTWWHTQGKCGDSAMLLPGALACTPAAVPAGFMWGGEAAAGVSRRLEIPRDWKPVLLRHGLKVALRDTQLEHGCGATMRSAFPWCLDGTARFHCGHWGWVWSCACIPGNPPAPLGKALLAAPAVLPCDKPSAGTCQQAPNGIIAGAVSRGSFKCHFPALITRDGNSNGDGAVLLTLHLPVLQLPPCAGH